LKFTNHINAVAIRKPKIDEAMSPSFDSYTDTKGERAAGVDRRSDSSTSASSVLKLLKCRKGVLKAYDDVIDMQLNIRWLSATFSSSFSEQSERRTAVARPKSPFVRRLFALRVREELLTELRHMALDRKQPANQLLETAIEEFLKKNREKKKGS
jgi:predicted HicB family RNase H-like nuclease